MYYDPPEPPEYCEEEHYEFNEKINDLIEDEIIKRVESEVANYEYALKTAAEAKETISDLRAEVRKLENKIVETSNESFKRGKEEAQRELLGGYKLSDQAWYVHTKTSREECSTCDKSGYIYPEFNGAKVKAKCPDCSYGTITKYEYVPAKVKIRQITVNTWADGKQLEVEYWVEYVDRKFGSDSFSIRSKDKLFKSEEECKLAAEKQL